MIGRRLLILSLAASILGGAEVAHAAYRVTGLDLYGHGVVTAAEPFAPPVGAVNYVHVTLSLWPEFAGNPYAVIPADATGTFHFSTIGGPWGFEVGIKDIGGWGACEVCDASFSLVDGEFNGPFSFDAGVDPVHFISVSTSSFWGEALGPDFTTPSYSGTFALDSVTIHTDAPAPEPATWVLMMAGFLGAGQALRLAARRSRAASTSTLAA